MTSLKLEKVLPAEIEKRSFEIISEELGDIILDKDQESIIKRVIHTTADFDYVESLYFSPNAVTAGIAAMKNHCTIITDTNMGKSGISKMAAAKLGLTVECFMADPEIAAKAKECGTTRAVCSMDKAAELPGDLIFAIGNAPTALIRLYELIEAGLVQPKLVIGVPVGFVNVEYSKELIMKAEAYGVPLIVARGRKGGSNVAAAICNALLYKITR